MIGVWLWSAAWADPVALRGLRDEPTVVLGLHDLSASIRLGEVGVAATVRTDRGAVDVAVGRRWQLRRGSRGWQIDGGVSGGLIVPLVRPTLGLTATPFIAAGPVQSGWAIQGVIAAPLAVTAVGEARLPLLFELQGAGTVGRVTIGPRFGVGPVVTPGTDTSFATEGALVVSLAPKHVTR
ncbi:MAG: hypothetical protein AAGA48_03765 [Myxococcota bacterium]